MNTVLIWIGLLIFYLFVGAAFYKGIAPGVRVLDRLVYGKQAVRSSCTVLHRTAQLEREIYGSVVSDSIADHLKTCPATRLIATYSPRPYPLLPDPGRTARPWQD